MVNKVISDFTETTSPSDSDLVLIEKISDGSYRNTTIASIKGAGSGESNTASNVGTGSDLFKQKSGVDLEFKRLQAGNNISLTNQASDVIIDVSSSLIAQNDLDVTLGQSNVDSTRTEYIGSGGKFVISRNGGENIEFETTTSEVSMNARLGDKHLRISNDNNRSIFFATNSVDRLTIDNLGAAGLGTSSPSQKLTVVDAAETYIGVGSSTANTGAGIIFAEGDSTPDASSTGGMVGYNGSSDRLEFAVGAGEIGLGDNNIAMVILKDPNYVGIGKTNPIQTLDVQGNIGVSGTVDGIDVGNNVGANNAFRTTPSTVITAGTNLTWSGNTLNATGGSGSSPLTTKGDLYGFSTVDARLAIGTNGFILTADSSEGLGLKWAAQTGGGDVSKVGTPVNDQLGVWTADGLIEGTSNLTFTNAALSIKATGTAGIFTALNVGSSGNGALGRGTAIVIEAGGSASQEPVVRLEGLNEVASTTEVGQFAVSLSTSGVWDEVLRITNNGNAGIGTTSPLQKTHIKVDANAGLSYGLELQNPDNTIGSSAIGMLMSVDSNGGVAKGGVAYERTSDWGRGAMHFLQESSATTTLPTMADSVLTILNSGNVGIGTTSPQGKLDIHSTTGTYFSRDADPTGQHIKINVDSPGNTISSVGNKKLSIINTANDTLVLGTNNLERLTILGNGDVGIRTASPTAPLEINGDAISGNDPELKLTSSGGATLMFEDTGEGTQWNINTGSTGPKMYFLYETLGDNTPVMTLTPQRNVGIGTASPTEKLHVAGNITVSNEAAILDEVPSNVNPVFVPKLSDIDTGIGHNGDGVISLIGNGNNVADFDGIAGSVNIFNNMKLGNALICDETAGENVSAGQPCYLKSDGKYWKTDASAEATASAEILLANETIGSDAIGEFVEYGEYTTTGLTAGATYYLSETSGAITTTAPTTSGAIVRIIGYAKSATKLKFRPDTSYVELI